VLLLDKLDKSQARRMGGGGGGEGMKGGLIFLNFNPPIFLKKLVFFFSYLE